MISQADFFFLDEEASQTLRQEAIRDVGAIFKIDEAQLTLFRAHLEHSLIENQQWRSQLPGSPFEELYSLLDKIEESLLQDRFSDQRTFNKMRSLKMDIAHFFVIDPASLQEDSALLPFSLWARLKRDLEGGLQFHAEAVDYLIAPFFFPFLEIARGFRLRAECASGSAK